MSKEKVIRKWMWVWDFEKEERWLNTMAQSGWVLTKVGFCTYHFTPVSRANTPFVWKCTRRIPNTSLL